MKTYDELKALITQRGVHAVFGEPGEGYFIEQNAEELAAFLVAMQELGVSSVLEIGTGYRAGLARFLNDDMGWTVTSIDVKNYGHSFSGITFVTTDVEPYSDETFDLVLIDADHSYEGVKNDHQTWAFHATKVIAFHDIAGLRDCEGVKQYWREIAIDGREYKPGYHEIIARTPERGGIGYIVLAEVAAEPEPLLTPETVAKLKPIVDEALEKLPPTKKPAAPRKPAAKKPAAKKTPARTAKK